MTRPNAICPAAFGFGWALAGVMQQQSRTDAPPTGRESLGIYKSRCGSARGCTDPPMAGRAGFTSVLRRPTCPA